MHYEDGMLRAYLDGEVNPDVHKAIAAHLNACADCQARGEVLASRAERVARHLAVLTPLANEAPTPASVALARFSASRIAHSTSPAYPWREKMNSRLKSLWTSHRLLWGSLAALLIFAFLLSLEPVRAAAGEILGIFRVRKFAVVPFDPNQVQLNGEVFSANINQLLSDSVTVLKEPGPPQSVASAAEASALAGIPVRLPATLPDWASTQLDIRVEEGMAAQIVVDRARAQALLDLAGLSDVQLPQALDGATVTIEVPPVVIAQYRRPQIGPGGAFVLTQLRSPTVNLPPGVNLAQLGEASLRLLGLSPEEARQFSRSIDWSSTLVIPLPTDITAFRDVSVDGVSGVLITERSTSERGYARHSILLWQKNGVVYSLAGQGDAEDILAVANSLQ
ncbi:MAG: hypothetical protein C4311_15660 [Chloroflexota bacterium]